MERMDLYISEKFECKTKQEIWEMNQFITGELFIYIDFLMTMDEERLRMVKDF